MELTFHIIAAGAALVLGAGAAFARSLTTRYWSFVIGMWLLAGDAALAAVLSAMPAPSELFLSWLAASLFVKALQPGVWLWFSLSYGRGDAKGFFKEWRWVLIGAFLLPVGVVVFREHLFEFGPQPLDTAAPVILILPVAKTLFVFMLISTLLVIVNLESTFRSAVGTVRWQIKFLVLGLGLIFAVRLYAFSHTIIFPAYEFNMELVNSTAVLIACPIIAIAHSRKAFARIDIYPSRDFLTGSASILIGGSFLLAIGLLAQISSWLGGSVGGFHLQTIVVLLGLTGFAIYYLSDRRRAAVQRLISRHFKRPAHDSRQVWTQLVSRLAGKGAVGALSDETAKFLVQHFDAMSVTFIELSPTEDRLRIRASTGPATTDGQPGGSVRQMLARHKDPFVLDEKAFAGVAMDKGNATEQLDRLVPTQFEHGGRPVCVPLWAENRWLGLVTMADRVKGVPYSQEELELLGCIGAHVGAHLHSLQLAGELLRARELEAFQTMSTFFVHDLKNAASTLSLTLRNLPKHFDDPEFRQDAIRSMDSTVKRINRLIERLGGLRRDVSLHRSPIDLIAVIKKTCGSVVVPDRITLRTDLSPVSQITADAELLQSVITNLVQNAIDAIDTANQATHGCEGKETEGEIVVSVCECGPEMHLVVADDGPGMTQEFVQTGLFAPFRSTKKNGLGIGMFQARVIVEQHGGRLRVDSAQGQGTRMEVILPVSVGTEEKRLSG